MGIAQDRAKLIARLQVQASGSRTLTARSVTCA